ncbi:hypothetical protein P8C59_004394 [Phyllachora maydis]|uniref:Uncharacterized protein n=1 Tax=Phyllachora maydis TaxID=1825666 RepID=A0AAD9I263_9PEZI|nr:hypothetical protein P8C59_004394 [Phyllachora maydis]
MSLQGKGKAKTREPPPTLFLHPSPTASQLSLPGITASGLSGNAQAQSQAAPPSSANLLRSSSHRGSITDRDAAFPASITSPTESRRPPGPALRNNPAISTHPPPPLSLHLPSLAAAAAAGAGLARRDSTRATDRTDALWAEMQATLEEVELSASGGTRVFGPDHDRKLADLRVAQIALAQAWARSEADEAIESSGAGGALGAEVRISKAPVMGLGAGDEAKAEVGADTAAAAAKGVGGGTGSGGPGSSGAAGGQERLGAKLEEETEVDILLARRRREANDRYFQRVNRGVLDVVAKLDKVALAMREVEQESKDVWGEGENDSVPGSAKG